MPGFSLVYAATRSTLSPDFGRKGRMLFSLRTTVTASSATRRSMARFSSLPTCAWALASASAKDGLAVS